MTLTLKLAVRAVFPAAVIALAISENISRSDLMQPQIRAYAERGKKIANHLS